MRDAAIALAFLAALGACGDKKQGEPTKQPAPKASAPKSEPAPAPIKLEPTSAPASAPSKDAGSLLQNLPDPESFLTQGEEVAGPKTFAYSFEKGEKASYQLGIRWRLKGLNLPLGNFTGEILADLDWVVLEVAADGKATIEVEYKKIALSVDSVLLGGKMSFDSAAGVTPETSPLLAPFAKMIGKKFSFSVNKQGSAAELKGQDAILEESLSDPKFPAELRAQIKATLGEEGLSKLLGQGLLSFPTKGLSKSESFEATPPALRVPGLGEVNLNEKVTLAAIRKLIDKNEEVGVFNISVFALLDPKGGPAVTAIPGVRLAGEATPTVGEGWFVFNQTRGIPEVALLPVPLDLKISILGADGKPSTPEPIEVAGEVVFSVVLGR